MKTPKQLRREIHDLSMHLSQVQVGLQNRATVKVANIGKECRRAAQALEQLLKSQQVPSEYKVAVVGRFKAGKSSFVNELLGNRLASEGTLPETAAVTTFKHGANVQASIRFVNRSAWQELKAMYAEHPKHVDAHRFRSWEGFRTPKKPKDGEAEKVFDLAGLEQEHVREEGHTVTLELPTDATKKATNEFRRQLKEYTSAGSPLHCLVDSIDITAPAEILDHGVLLIDTPGLDDTERFRVTLTERVVADVDAVLFLTKSGASYGQSEKDFLLSLLRKGTVKQLIVVVTQIDETYNKVLAEADDNDEDPESIAACIARERAKISREIADTLKDLEQDDSLHRYQEQLGEVPIAFTSARLHRDWKDGKGLPFVIDTTDPGGVEQLKARLLKMLSTESRLAQTAENIVKGASSNLLNLQSVLQTKLQALHNTQNKEVAEKKLHLFREQFGQAGERFTRTVDQQIELLKNRLEGQPLRDETLLGYIGALAEQPLSAFETDDMGKHWKTRRNGGWGYMRGLQGSVANLVFPKVQQLLEERTKLFSKFAKQFEQALVRLSNDSERVAHELELGASVPLDVSGKLKSVLNRSVERAHEIVAKAEQDVLRLLEDFVTDDVADRISEKRRVVEKIWDVGTTIRQNAEIKAFYREVKALLRDALNNYLKSSSHQFGKFLLEEAKAAPRDAIDDVQVLLEQAADNILAATAEHLAGQKEAALMLIDDIEKELQQTLERVRSVMPTPAINAASPTEHTVTLLKGSDNLEKTTPAQPPSMQQLSNDWADLVQAKATISVARLQLNDGATGWSYERLFAPEFLQGALHLSLVDPYLTKPHQFRNLKEFLLHAAEVAKPKTIEVVTAADTTDGPVHQDQILADVSKDLFDQLGVALTWRRETGLHDRCLRLDHGVLFKLGRGLDVYKPATGLSAHRPASRRVRSTEIDVFAVAGHPLTPAQKTED